MTSKRRKKHKPEQMVAKLRAMVVIDQSECAGHILGVRGPSVGRQLVPDQLSYGLASRGEMLLRAETVELLQQVVF